MKYIYFHRMQRAYDALRRTPPGAASVADVMARYGFRDVGRFADACRELYGELPFETVHRGLRPAVSDFGLSSTGPGAKLGNIT